jgi:hypothetical protein
MKERFQNQVLSAKPVLERLTDILTTAKNEMEDAEINGGSFQNPNWANKQAYILGQKASLGYVIKLINLDQQELNDR